MDVNPLLINKIMACPSMSSIDNQRSVVNMLPEKIRGRIAVGATTTQNAANIVSTCQASEGGMKALIAAIEFFDDGTIAFSALKQFLKDNPSENQASQSTSATAVPVSNQPAVPALPTRLKILFISADPTDGARLRLGKEFSDIDRRIQQAGLRDKFEMSTPQTSLTTDNIQRELLEKKPQIVHFSGHGERDGRLYFENADGTAAPVSIVALERLFGRLKSIVQCVVLNACYSQEQAEAIAKNITYVVGMSEPISDVAALAFANGFYVGLGAGAINEQSDPFEDAYNAGCDQIAFTANENEVSIPVFYKAGQLAQGSYD